VRATQPINLLDKAHEAEQAHSKRTTYALMQSQEAAMFEDKHPRLAILGIAATGVIGLLFMWILIP
jgi:hypothetical protein